MMNQTARARPLVSVVIPTFNRATVLARAVSSVLDQSLQDFEVLIVDDGSTDGTRDVINEFRDARLNVMTFPVRRGAGAARNTGIEHSQGKYIAFLDSDDEYLPSFLEVLVNHLEMASSAEAAVLPSFYLSSADGTTTTVRYLTSLQYRELLRFTQATRPFIVARAEALSRLRFDPNLVAYQEWDLFMRMLWRTRIAALDTPEVIVHDEGDEPKISSARNQIDALGYLMRKYAAALRRDPFATRQWHMKLVRLHMAVGQVRQARAEARRAALTCPRHVRTWGLFLPASTNDRAFIWAWSIYRSQSVRAARRVRHGEGEF